MDAELIPWIFASIMTLGVVYLLISLIFGGIVEGLHIDTHVDIHVDGFADADAGAEGRGIGCSVIAAFLAGFGSVGLFGSLSGWNIIVSIIVSLLSGVLLARVVIAVLRFVVKQESSDLLKASDIVGSFARVTVNTPAGKKGEALLEGRELIKYPVKNLNDTPLKKGDYVEVIEVSGGTLYVKKKNV